MSDLAELALTDLKAGWTFSYEITISEKMINQFAELTGDVNPLHMDEEFATRRGFLGRVVHGALLNGLFSRLIGVHLPGRSCLLHSMSVNYLLPVYANRAARVTGTVEQISAGANAIILNLEISDIYSERVVAKGKATIGFSKER